MCKYIGATVCVLVWSDFKRNGQVKMATIFYDELWQTCRPKWKVFFVDNRTDYAIMLGFLPHRERFCFQYVAIYRHHFRLLLCKLFFWDFHEIFCSLLTFFWNQTKYWEMEATKKWFLTCNNNPTHFHFIRYSYLCI